MSLFGTTAFSLKNDFDQNKLSSTEVIRYIYKRINSLNYKINAYISLFEDEALSYAAKVDSLLNDTNQNGRLQGIPLAVSSDLLKTTNESTSYKNDIINILKDEGAIILGTTSRLANNPWNISKSAGSTSGGAAAAVSAGMASLALSLDDSNKIIEAAAFCGVLGFKTSLSTDLSDYITSKTHADANIGIYAKSVIDCALLLDVLDSSLKIHYIDIYDFKYRDYRIAVFEDLLNECYDKEIKNSIEMSVAALKGLGFTVDKITSSNQLLLNNLKNKSNIKNLFNDYEIVLSPSTQVLPYTSECICTKETYRMDIFKDYPTLSLPCGFSSSDLPIGLQLVSDNGNDLMLLQVAATLEKRLSLSIM